MTEKLFYTDVHTTSFTASVLSCEKADDGSFSIVLDRTAFFPEEGGQKADRGTLDQEPVLDVRIKEDTIYHKLAVPLTPGSCVTGEVDWDRRFDFMQQHTGEHIISGLVQSRYGFHNVGFHLGDEEVTLDFDGVLTLTQLRGIEQEANAIITQNLPVLISFPTSDELALLSYRSKIEIEGDVRIVEIPGCDICACCAPHLDFTGQIGLIKITAVQKHRGGIRVNILCGRRAIADYTQKQDSVFAISVLLSAKPDSVAGFTSRLKEENQKQKNRLIAMQKQLLEFQIQAVPKDQEDVLLFLEDLDTPAMRSAVNLLCAKRSGYCAVFVGNDETGYSYILGSQRKDCLAARQLLSDRLNAKGGGSERMIQGSLKASQAAVLCLFSQPIA